MLYAAYGSNLCIERLEERVGKILSVGTVKLENWSLNFDKMGLDKTGKCNIKPTTHNHVFFALYELSARQLKILDGYERGYVSEMLAINKTKKAQTYIAKTQPIGIKFPPAHWYLEFVVKGAKQHRFPSYYVDFIESFSE